MRYQPGAFVEPKPSIAETGNTVARRPPTPFEQFSPTKSSANWFDLKPTESLPLPPPTPEPAAPEPPVVPLPKEPEQETKTNMVSQATLHNGANHRAKRVMHYEPKKCCGSKGAKHLKTCVERYGADAASRTSKTVDPNEPATERLKRMKTALAKQSPLEDPVKGREEGEHITLVPMKRISKKDKKALADKLFDDRKKGLSKKKAAKRHNKRMLKASIETVKVKVQVQHDDSFITKVLREVATKGSYIAETNEERTTAFRIMLDREA